MTEELKEPLTAEQQRAKEDQEDAATVERFFADVVAPCKALLAGGYIIPGNSQISANRDRLRVEIAGRVLDTGVNGEYQRMPPAVLLAMFTNSIAQQVGTLIREGESFQVQGSDAAEYNGSWVIQFFIAPLSAEELKAYKESKNIGTAQADAATKH